MLELGKVQELLIIKKVEFGVYLAESEEEGKEIKVLLPKKQVPSGAEVGEKLSVFLYRDSSDRLIATTRTPKLQLGGTACLTVLETGKIGAFLDWGLEKDLLLPFRQQTQELKVGDNCLVALYTDKSQRLCATMDVYKYLRKDSPYKKEDHVTGFLYEINDDFGAYVAVDNLYSAMIPKKEITERLEPGMQITARVTTVKPDGKLDLSLREKSYMMISGDSEKILQMMEEDGMLLFTDKAAPELIREKTGMSKNEFKRAVGNLLKNKKIIIEENRIKKI